MFGLGRDVSIFLKLKILTSLYLSQSTKHLLRKTFLASVSDGVESNLEHAVINKVESIAITYFKKWIEGKKPPAVRMGLERDYREHFRRYILPQFESVKLKDVQPRKLLDFRTYLTGERGLKMKSARTIIDASFRAMMRDAR